MLVYLIICVVVVLFCIWYVKLAGDNKKLKNKILELQKTDERFINSKCFDFINTSYILISETGDIALKSNEMKEIRFLNIKEIIGFEILTNGKQAANIGGAVVWRCRGDYWRPTE
jgi:hypothetical protein